jgi:hypothetical protein
MQKLSDEVWKSVYDDYMLGHKLSDLFWGNECLIDAHLTPAAFKKAFDNFLSRAKLPERD